MLQHGTPAWDISFVKFHSTLLSPTLILPLLEKIHPLPSNPQIQKIHLKPNLSTLTPLPNTTQPEFSCITLVTTNQIWNIITIQTHLKLSTISMKMTLISSKTFKIKSKTPQTPQKLEFIKSIKLFMPTVKYQDHHTPKKSLLDTKLTFTLKITQQKCKYPDLTKFQTNAPQKLAVPLLVYPSNTPQHSYI